MVVLTRFLAVTEQSCASPISKVEKHIGVHTTPVDFRVGTKSYLTECEQSRKLYIFQWIHSCNTCLSLKLEHTLPRLSTYGILWRYSFEFPLQALDNPYPGGLVVDSCMFVPWPVFQYHTFCHIWSSLPIHSIVHHLVTLVLERCQRMILRNLQIKKRPQIDWRWPCN